VHVLTAVLTLLSPAFHTGSRIPARYTCTGANVSPPLRWTAPPPGTRALALLVVDPDAPSGAFTHWTLWNLPTTRRALPAHFKWRWQGRNDAGSIGYTGPCPPPGPKHHYTFTLYPLRRALTLPRGASPGVVVSAIVHQTRRTATLVGTYSR
jgi:Raf kinase inhibitor-like YbhB/YbcL family protein